MRLLVYTCVFGGYDRVFPPVVREPGVDYVLVTDDETLHVDGWRMQLVEAGRFTNARAANRHYKMIGHGELGTHDVSIYVDGNIRVLGAVSELARRFADKNAALGVYPHPRRKTVAEEAEACISSGKVDDPDVVRQELEYYRAQGFPDEQGLIEATVLFKNHAEPKLDESMSAWWSLYQRFGSRDQFSLPFVLWKTRASVYRMPTSFRDPNPHFGIYPHFAAKGVPRAYAYLCARAYDSPLHRLGKWAWEEKWRMQRRLRTTR